MNALMCVANNVPWIRIEVLWLLWDELPCSEIHNASYAFPLACFISNIASTVSTALTVEPSLTRGKTCQLLASN